MSDWVILTVGNVHLNHVNECYWNCGRLSCVACHLPSECRENPIKVAHWDLWQVLAQSRCRTCICVTAGISTNMLWTHVCHCHWLMYCRKLCSVNIVHHSDSQTLPIIQLHTICSQVLPVRTPLLRVQHSNAWKSKERWERMRGSKVHIVLILTFVFIFIL